MNFAVLVAPFRLVSSSAPRSTSLEPRRALLVLAVALASACDAPPTPPPPATDAGSDAPRRPPPSVMTSLGVIEGVRGAGFSAFLGIPYAEPPVGELRWASPVPHAGWSEPLLATRPPASCPQAALGARIGREDCLFLNVHAPDPAPTGAPVIVWMHGGGFVFGEGLQLDRGTAGDILARDHGVVVVSMNYRLGVLGFFAHPSLPGATGNQGIEDQRLALEWVRDHIADLGGDPGNVTIVGESAGGMSVCAHMVSPASRGLFHRVISQSGLCDSTRPSVTEQEGLAAMVATTLGCAAPADVATCLRAATPDALLDAIGDGADIVGLVTGEGIRFGPSIDPVVLPLQFRDAVSMSEIAEVPTMIGWTRDEGTLFVALAEDQGIVADDARYHEMSARLATETGLEVAAIEAAYPLASYPDPGAAIADMSGDQGLACPSRRAALLLAGAGIPTHVYRFDQLGAGFQLALERDMGAFHSAEIQFVFGHPVGVTSFDAEQTTLHMLMSDAWARFARTGDPNGTLPTWPPFAAGTEPSMTLTAFPVASSAVDADDCALWDGAPTP